MEFNEKLQELRKREGMTQEELAGKLYVSRTAISKWESGRGYPNIESLKAISKLFGVTVDELLSSDEILSMAEEDGKQKTRGLQIFIVGLLDVCAALLLFLPFFAQKKGDFVESVSLLSLTEVHDYLKIMFFIAVIGTVIWGIAEILIHAIKRDVHSKSLMIISMILSFASILIFILSLKPYAAIFTFALLIIKVLMLIKR